MVDLDLEVTKRPAIGQFGPKVSKTASDWPIWTHCFFKIVIDWSICPFYWQFKLFSVFRAANHRLVLNKKCKKYFPGSRIFDFRPFKILIIKKLCRRIDGCPELILWQFFINNLVSMSGIFFISLVAIIFTVLSFRQSPSVGPW